jgi:alpha-beta hydrolase superfamily lysophospholipase
MTSLLFIIVGSVGLVLAGLSVSWCLGWVLSRGRSEPVARAIPPAIDLQLLTPDGLTLAATHWPGVNDTAPGVLLLHGVDASRAALASNAAWLARLGYAVLTIDFRGHGQSSLSTRSFGLKESIDARTAFEWLKLRQRHSPVAVIGISMGGAACLLGKDGPLPADALILQAVYPEIRSAIRNRIAVRIGEAAAHLLEPLLSFQAKLRFGVWPSEFAPARQLRTVVTPVMVVGGMDDRSTPPSELRKLFEAAPNGRKLWLADIGDHELVCRLDNASYRAQLADFLAETIGRPGAKVEPAIAAT